MRKEMPFLISLLCTSFLHGAVWSQTSTTVRESSSGFGRGRVFFQHVNVGRDEYQSHLHKVIGGSDTSASELAVARCELALLTEDPKSALPIVLSEFTKQKLPEISNILCRCRLRVGDFVAGEELCRALIKSNPNNTDAHLLLCLVTKRITPEVREIAAIDPYAWLVMAAVFGSKNDYQNCADTVRRYLELKKTGPLMQEEYAHSNLGIALFKLKRRDLETATILEKAFELSSEYQRSALKNRSELATFISDCYSELNKTSHALEWAETGYKLDPESTDANYALGRAIIILRQSDELFTSQDELAVKCLNRVLDRTQNLEVALNLSRFLELKGRESEAIFVLKPHVSKATDVSIRLHLMSLIVSQKTISEAEIEFVKRTLLANLSISKVGGEFRKGYVACLIGVGNLPEARRAVEELRKLEQSTQLREDIAHLDRLIDEAARTP